MDFAQKILKDVVEGQRLSFEQALYLSKNATLHDLGLAAFEVRTKKHGNKAYYVYNQHLNFTNVCENQCKFCAFFKKKNDKDAYTLSIEQIAQKIEERITEPMTEIHIVGGLNTSLPYEYYIELLSIVKKIRPQVNIKSFTAVEIAFLADTHKLSEEKVLSDFRDAGMDALSGGGAEIFAAHMREKLCPEKVSGERWLKIHALCHDMGIPTTSTMLFGHIESWEDRVAHLEALRNLQDTNPGFLCFIPLVYQSKNNELAAVGAGGEAYLRMVALSRLYLDNFNHIKAYWAFSGIKLAQMALWAGADDFDGTLVSENVGHAAGANTPSGLTLLKLKDYIQQAGFEPVERNALFEDITTI